MKWTDSKFYGIPEFMSDFGGSYKTLQMLFSLFLMPLFAWEVQKLIAKSIKKNDKTLEEKSMEDVKNEIESRFDF